MSEQKIWTKEEKNWSEEEVYDREISPLMKRILDICKQHKIPMVASFQYTDGDERGPGSCTSKLVFPERPPWMPFLRFVHSWPERPVVLTETHVTKLDGSKVITIGRVS
jgi:hypothetical protein